MRVLGAGTAQKGTGAAQKKGGLRHVYNPKKGGIYNLFCKKRESQELKLLKRGSWELIYLSSPLLINMLNWVGMFWKAKQDGHRCGHSSKKGVLCSGKTRKKGVLRCGSGPRGGSLPRHIPILNIYVSTPPPPGSVPCPLIYASHPTLNSFYENITLVCYFLQKYPPHSFSKN